MTDTPVCTCNITLMGMGEPPDPPCKRHGAPVQIGDTVVTHINYDLLKRERDALEATCARQGDKLARIAALLEQHRGAPLGLPATHTWSTKTENEIALILSEKGTNRG